MIQRPPELFVSERPIRSDYSRERSYARRRFITVIVLVFMLAGLGYTFWGRGGPNPADIPTIKAEGGYKQKPTEPGGIDIPHQDVRVYDQLEGKNASSLPQIEHLLPPPEVPKEMPPAPVAVQAPIVQAPVAAATAPPMAAPLAAVETKGSATAAASLVPVAPSKATVLPEIGVKQIETTVTASHAAPANAASSQNSSTNSSPSSAPAEQAVTIEQIIEKTKASSPSLPQAQAVSSGAALSSGSVAVQLASVPDEAKAKSMMEALQKKYAVQLGSTSLQLVRADLGSRGVYYRIQSQGLAEEDASRLCSTLKQMNAGCILVKK